MSRSRPCRICQKWFRPDRRVGDRQHVCGELVCQKERHRRACSQWHAKNRGYDADSRLRRRLQRESTSAVSGLEGPIFDGLDLEVARDAVGPQVVVLLELVTQVLWNRVRDVVVVQPVGKQQVRAKVLVSAARDEIAERPPPS